MKNPLMPFAAIMALGIVLVFVIAIYGATQGDGGQEKASGGSATNQEQKKEENSGGSGESSKADPKAIFEGNCASCHGPNLEGGIGPALDHIGKTMSKDDILKQIANGGGAMPGGLIQGDDADIVAEWLAAKK